MKRFILLLLGVMVIGSVLQAQTTVTFRMDASATGFAADFYVRGDTAPLNWDPGAAMTHTGGGMMEVTLQFAAGVESIEYKYYHSTSEGWEDFGGNRVLDFDGRTDITVNDIWGIPGAILPEDVEVTFNLDMTVFEVGDLVVLGDYAPLTDWGPGIAMTYLEDTTWTATVNFPEGSSASFDFKYRNTVDGTEYWWPEGYVNLEHTIDPEDSDTWVVNHVFDNPNNPGFEMPILTEDIDVTFYLNMGSYDVGTLQLRGEGTGSGLTWDEDPDFNLVHYDGRIYTVTHTFPEGAEGLLYYKYTNDLGEDGFFWFPDGPNLRHIIDPEDPDTWVVEDVFEHEWNPYTPTSVSNNIWKLMY